VITATWKDVVNVREVLLKTNFSYWLQNNLFTWQWWLLLSILVLSYAIWWKLINKKRLSEILLFHLLVMVLSGLLDLYGTQYMLWGYPSMVFPGAPPLFIDNYGAIPPVYSLIYQYFDKWKSYLIAMFIASLCFSFIVEPIFVWTNIYDIPNWKYIYSFPTLIILGVVAKGIVEKVKHIQNKQ
jgi:hypothetical protein